MQADLSYSKPTLSPIGLSLDDTTHITVKERCPMASAKSRRPQAKIITRSRSAHSKPVSAPTTEHAHDHQHDHEHQHGHDHSHEHQDPLFPSASAGIITALGTASATGMLINQRLVLLTALGYIEGDYIDENTDLSDKPRETFMRNLAVFGNELYEGHPRTDPHSFIHLSNVVIRAHMEVRVDNLIVFCDQVIAATIARTLDSDAQ